MLRGGHRGPHRDRQVRRRGEPETGVSPAYWTRAGEVPSGCRQPYERMEVGVPAWMASCGSTASPVPPFGRAIARHWKQRSSGSFFI